MDRFIILSCVLLWLGPQAWAKKPQPPAISTCYGRICLTGLRWRPPNVWSDKPDSTIEGVLINQSTSALSFVNVAFALKSGANLFATATAIYDGELPPGGRWYFEATIFETDRRIFLTRSESVKLNFTVGRGTRDTHSFRETLRFDPLFSRANRSERKAWEKIHGKRQR
jgi:hypothetical protein